jgi:hypothetical protein
VVFADAIDGAARALNLAPAPPDEAEAAIDIDGALGLILCRNIGMYLRTHSASALWSRLTDALAHGGYLVLGKAERPGASSGLASIGQYLYRRTGQGFSPGPRTAEPNTP